MQSSGINCAGTYCKFYAVSSHSVVKPTPTSVSAPGLVALRISLNVEPKLAVGLLPVALSPEDPAAVAVRLHSSVGRLLGERERIARRGGEEAEQEHQARVYPCC